MILSENRFAHYLLFTQLIRTQMIRITFSWMGNSAFIPSFAWSWEDDCLFFGVCVKFKRGVLRLLDDLKGSAGDLLKRNKQKDYVSQGCLDGFPQQQREQSLLTGKLTICLQTWMKRRFVDRTGAQDNFKPGDKPITVNTVPGLIRQKSSNGLFAHLGKMLLLNCSLETSWAECKFKAIKNGLNEKNSAARTSAAKLSRNFAHTSIDTLKPNETYAGSSINSFHRHHHQDIHSHTDLSNNGQPSASFMSQNNIAAWLEVPCNRTSLTQQQVDLNVKILPSPHIQR